MNNECGLEDRLYNLFILSTITKPINLLLLNSEEMKNILGVYGHICICDLHSNYLSLYIDELTVSKSNTLKLLGHNIIYLSAVKHILQPSEN